MRFTHKNVHGDLTTLPGCSQVVVSHNVFAWPRKGGNAIEASVYRGQHAFDHGYDYMVCTVDITNEVQLAILARTGWIRLDTFISRKTGHTVVLCGKRLENADAR